MAAGSREEASFPPSLGVFLAGGEGQRVEFKREVPAERRLVRLLAGLANAGGGVVLFGVDARGRVVGLPDPAEVEEALKANRAVSKLLKGKELDMVMDPTNYVGQAPEMVDRTVAYAEATLGRKII